MNQQAELTKHILQTLANGGPEEVSEALGFAAFCFEKTAMTSSREDLRIFGSSLGLPQSIVDDKIDEDELKQIKSAIEDFMRSSRLPSELHGAAWALGKAGDPKLRRFLCDMLRAHLNGDSGLLYNLLIAIRNTGDDPFRGCSSSHMDVDKNRILARDYVGRVRESSEPE